MKVRKFGEGEAEYVVLTCLHGNEPCGKYAMDRVINEDLEFKKPVKFILANEKALNQDKNHIDEDLNRVFPSDGDETHEKRLAKKLQRELKGTVALDIHSSYSTDEVFVIMAEDSDTIKKQTGKIGVKYLADISSEVKVNIPDCKRVSVECGYTGSEGAIRNAYRLTKQFLKANDIIEGDTGNSSKPEMFEIYDRVEGSGYQFTKENFKKVEEGETYAINGSDRIEAQEEFYPVLMSTTGYDGMVGFKAKKFRENGSI